MSRVDELFAQFNKKAKYEIAKSGVKWEATERIPFSSPRINYCLYGGIPLGSITELYGGESAGKTTTSLDIVANAQKLYPDRDVIFIDVEGTFDSRWADTLGVDIANLKYMSPREETAEQIFQMVIDLLSDADTDISLIVIDSLAPMISQQAYEKDMEGSTYGGISKPLTLFSNKVAPILRKKNCALIALNQVRDDMNSMYGGTTTPGGRAWKHVCSVRLECRRSDYFDSNGNVVSTTVENPAGHFVKLRVAKTKICRPDRKVGFYALNYLSGIDKVLDLVDVGVKLGVFRQGGAWYYCFDENGEELKFQGKTKFRDYLEDNEEFYNLQESRINELLLPETDIKKSEKIRQIIESDVPEDR